MFELNGTRAVIVGAGRGIGAEIAVALTRAGSSVVLAGRDSGRLSATREAVERHGSVLGLEEVDVTSPQSIAVFAERVVDRFGAPTILVNSANVRLVASALETSADDWDATHHVQLRGPFLTSRAFAPAMIDQGYGKIINMSSQWAVRAGPQRSAYAAAKAGLSQLTAALAVEWAAYGIRVNAIAPGATRTESLVEMLDRFPGREEFVRQRIPLGRLGAVEDVAPAAVYLSSRESDFVTGHTLFVDGGASIAA